MKRHITFLPAAFLLFLAVAVAGCQHMDENGTTEIDYSVTGVVLSKDSIPLRGIRVRVYDPYVGGARQWSTETLTDADGSFATERVRSVSLKGLSIVFDDIDGDAGGGAFQKDSIAVDRIPRTSFTQRKRPDGWYQGAWEIRADMVLQPSE